MKKGAIELSVGTIVIIVLAMSMLILGIILVKNIFSGATDIATMTNDQLKNQVNQLFGEDKKLVMYPDTRLTEITQGELNGFGIGIKNLLKGVTDNPPFSYEVKISDSPEEFKKKCGVNEEIASNWIVTGKSETGIPLPAGETRVGKILLQIPEGTPLCVFRLAVNVYTGTGTEKTPYATDFMDISIEA